MTSIVVTAVGGIAPPAAGSATVTNSAQAVLALPPHWTGGIGRPWVYPPGGMARIDLVDALSTGGSNFFFGEGPYLITRVGVQNVGPFGTPHGVVNAAQALYPVGFNAYTAGGVVVWDSAKTGGMLGLTLGEQLSRPYDEIRIFWGAPTITVRGVAAPTINPPDVKKPIDAGVLLGFGGSIVGRPIVSDTSKNGNFVPFNFVDPDVPPTALSVPFYFGGASVISAVGAMPAPPLGLASAINAAQGISAVGRAHELLGRPFGLHKRPAPEQYINFAQGYAPTTARNVPFYFGIDGLVEPAGIPSPETPAPGVDTVKISCPVEGWDSLVVSVPGSFAALPALLVAAIRPDDLFGEPKVILAKRWVKMVGADFPVWGSPYVAWDRQYVYPTQFVSTSSGQVGVTRSPRYLEPEGILQNFYTDPVFGFTRSAAPEGSDMVLFGQANFADNTQRVFALGWEGVVPPPTAMNWITYAGVVGFLTRQDVIRWGRQEVFNSAQYVEMYFDPDANITSEPLFGRWVEVRNGSAELQTFGLVATRWGYPTVSNNARLVEPEGIPAEATGEFYKAGQVSFWVQPLALEGIAPTEISRWSVVYNGARPIFTVGAAHSALGRPSAAKNGAEGAGGIYSFTDGTPFVDFAIRVVSQARAVDPPYVPVPEAALAMRYVGVVGVSNPQVGGPAVSAHRNLIAAFGRPFMVFGAPTMRNNTPEVATLGADHQEFGDAGTRTSWRSMATQSPEVMSLFGRVRISDRRLWVEYVTIAPGIFGDVTIVRIGAEPPSIRTIYPTQIGWAPLTAFGETAVGAQSLFPTGVNSLKFGDVVAYSNVVRLLTGIVYPRMEPGPAITHRNRVLSVAGISNRIEASRARISPHMVYACVATKQAVGNHDNIKWYAVDTDPDTGESLSGPGAPHIELRHRGVSAWGVSPPSVGYPELESTISLISAAGGIRGLRVGALEVFGGNIAPIAATGSDMGVVSEEAQVAAGPYLGPQTIPAPPASDVEFGVTNVSNWVRFVPVGGVFSQRFGTSDGGTTRFMHQALHVGFRDNPPIEGFEATLWGDLWASNKVRELLVTGFDTHESDYSPGGLNKRMRVKNATVYSPPTLAVMPAGEGQATFGAGSIRNNTQVISPDGNFETFRQGAYL